MNLADVMDELGVALETITGLRVSAFPADHVTPPHAVVGYPEEYVFDLTYGRGTDSMTFPVFVVVGKMWDRTTRDVAAAYADGAGAGSVKAAVDGGAYVAASSVRVTNATFETVSVAGVEFLAVVFQVDVFGIGA